MVLFFFLFSEQHLSFSPRPRLRKTLLRARSEIVRVRDSGFCQLQNVLIDGTHCKNVCSRRGSYSDLKGKHSTDTNMWPNCQHGYIRSSIVIKNSSIWDSRFSNQGFSVACGRTYLTANSSRDSLWSLSDNKSISWGDNERRAIRKVTKGTNKSITSSTSS